MRRFLTSRLFRAFVCLILVCCVLVLNSPIRVQAVLATSTAILIGAAAVLILGTMGIVLAPQTEAEFAAVGQDLSEWMYNATKKTDSEITDVQVADWFKNLVSHMSGGKNPNPDPLKPSAWDVFITAQFMLWAKEFLGDRFVDVPTTDGSGVSYPLSRSVVLAGTPIPVSPGVYAVCSTDVWYFGTYKYINYADGSKGLSLGNYFFSTTPRTDFQIQYSDKASSSTVYFNNWNTTLDGDKYAYSFRSWSGGIRADNEAELMMMLSGRIASPDVLDYSAILFGADPVVPNSYTLTPELIEQAIQENISAIEALKAWQAGDPVEIPDVEYGNILTETQTLTESVTQIQTQLAQGNMTLQQYLDTLTNGSGVNFNGGGTGSGGNDPSTPTPPSSDIAPFMLDLKDFFPFCIPFDLYKFFSLLCAEPEAPVFTWVVQDLGGNSYPITVDLSKWDNFAALFRKLQLFVFIIGLAMSSRKFIKW